MVCLVFVFPSHMIRHQRTVCILFTRQIEQRSRQVANQKGFLANQNGVLANQPGIVASQNCALASQNVCNLTCQSGILASQYAPEENLGQRKWRVGQPEITPWPAKLGLQASLNALLAN